MNRGGGFALKLLGTFRLDGPDGTRIDIRSKRGQAMLAMLALARDGERSRGWLQQALWTDRAPEQAGASLRRELSTLRGIVNGAGQPLLDADMQTVRLDLGRVRVDALQADLPSNIELLEGLDFPSGEGFDDWLRTERQALAARVGAGSFSSPIRSSANARSGTNGAVAIADADQGSNPDHGASLAVLRFEQAGDAVSADTLGDFVADLIDLLGRNVWLRLLARSSGVAFASGAGDPRAPGASLGVRYLLEGRLAPNGTAKSLRVELTEAATATSLKVDRYNWHGEGEGDSGGGAGAQQELVAEIAAAIANRIEAQEQRRAMRVARDEASAAQLVWQARHHLAIVSDETHAAARSLLDRALELDPGLYEARIESLWLTIRDLWLSRGRTEDIRKARREAQLLVIENGEDARTYMLGGIAELFLGHPLRARTLLRQAVELNPGLAMARAQLGSALHLNGECEEAIGELERAIRLSPNDRDLFYMHGELAMAHLFCGFHDRAIEHAEKSLALRTGYWIAHVAKVAALVAKGDPDAAGAALADLRASQPRFRAAHIDWLPHGDPAALRALHDALNRAGGLPD